ncbi:helix-turn-helix domain-containing protein [Enterococcus gilvus]|uniref:helix-turn-helix domain-containing protein n=1 Tax=Enterococcus gilvus TaxID=160453 RepID=UPI001C8CE4D5|nr:helix-turn-helix domain-containing protein [Enterococcus gilvus]MBX8936954.1 helix-turn-helix domain-containing protein [Enterococcus gilvus]
MNRILILTKNISVETYLQQQLQKLNYEVLVSVSIWEMWENARRVDQFMKSFQWIFLSETISEGEAKEFGEQFRTDCLVRIVGEEPPKEQVSEWDKWHIFDWVLTATTLERLREKLLHKTLMQQVEFIQAQATQPFYEARSLAEKNKKAFPLYFSDIHFTKLEKDIIQRLGKSKSLSLKREELCRGWRSKNQNSKLSQLSSAVTKIRKKVFEAYGIEEAVHTIWGEGYQLNTYFYQCLLKGELRNQSQHVSI